MPAAFDDLRVLDLSRRLSGAYCTRLFADLGAHVLLIEPPEGHPLRAEPPFLDDQPGPDRSLLHAYVNANKQSLVANDGLDLAAQVVAADLIVTTDTPLPDETRAALEAKRDDAVHLSLTPFGLDGPLTGAPANNLTHSAMSGWAHICGYEDEPPLALPRHSADYVAGITAFSAAAAALVRRVASGYGSLVDVSELDALIVSSFPWSLSALYEGPDGYPVHVHSRDRPAFQQAADGDMVVVLGQGPFWKDALSALGLDDLADASFDDPGVRRSHLASIQERVAQAIAQRPRLELFEELSRIRVVTGVVQDTSDLLVNPHLAEREYFVETAIDGRSAQRPGPPFRLSKTPWKLRRPAPRLDEHDQAPTPTPAPFSVRSNHAPPAEAPLAGVRVLTFTQAWSGTLGTELLALLGADVVQIEARCRPDVWRTYRGGFDVPVPALLVDPSRRQRGWNCMGLYNAANLNKRAITLDMNEPRGAEIFWRLVPRFDVVADNFSPHALPNWGITYETLREARPDIIFAALSGYGATGPYTHYAANGGTIEPMSGLSSLNGYEDDRPTSTGGLLPDPVGGMYFSSAIIAALHHRARTGEGQQIDISMTEAMAAHLGDALLERSANGVVRRPGGNRHPRIAPHGVYATTDGEWLALAAETDDAWRALAAHMRQPQLADDARFATPAARKANEDALDATIAAWCAHQDAAQAASALLALGCAAARVEHLTEVLESPNPQTLARGFMVNVEHPEAGTHTLAVAPWRFSGKPVPPIRPSPCLGEHSFEVFHAELGLTQPEYDALVDAGVTGDMPPD